MTIGGDVLTTDEKYDALLSYLKNLGSAAVAFSSGVDSTFLLYAAKEALSDKVIAVTAKSCSFPERELDEAVSFCREQDIRQVVISSKEIENESYRKNPKDRCYICKSGLFEQIREVAAENGMNAVIEGSNKDDEGDYRPGLVAIKEQGILSPLRELGLTKPEIRELSKKLDLNTWDKPSYACLASRVPYGEEINEQKLRMVEKAEQLLIDMGLKQVRVRIHGTLARIEADPSQFDILLENREQIVSRLRGYGFTYIALDMQGYRTGSMNETIKTDI